MKKNTIQVEAIQLNQNGHQVFMARVPTSVLIEHSQVDVWKPGMDDPRENGYQRNAMQSHYSKVARFLETQPLMPTSILLCVRDEVQFEPYTRGRKPGFAQEGGFGTLELPTENIYLVDGQHRVAGLRYAVEEHEAENLLEYEIPVVIMAGVDKEEEVKQFYTVNTTAKKIKTDLAERLISEMAERDSTVKDNLVGKGKGWLLRAIVVGDALNDRANSVWHDKIQLPNTKKLQGVSITQSSFANSLKPIFSIPWVGNMPDDKVAEIVDRYWTAIGRVMPEVFENPNEYSIQKSLGVNCWHIAAPAVLELAKGARLTVEAIEDVLRYAANQDEETFDAEFWQAGGEIAAYSSRSGFQILANRIEAALPSSESFVEI